MEKKIDTLGRIVIPKRMLTKLGWKPFPFAYN